MAAAMTAAPMMQSSMASLATMTTSPLPTRLMNFFAKYPPQLYSAKYTAITIPLTRREAQLAAETTTVEGQSDSSIPTAMSDITSSLPESISETLSILDTVTESQSLSSSTTSPSISSRKNRVPPNPFMPYRNPENGHWRGAAIGLRRQAELVKIAKVHGVEALLPPGRKSTAFKEHRILEKGLRVRGTGEGQKVKGHIWERKLPALLEKRTKAMEEMPETIRLWKQRGHGRGWKKYPK